MGDMDKSLIGQRSGVDAAAIAEREAEILGKPQRVAEIKPEDIGDDALALINRIRAGAGAGPVTPGEVPGYFLTMLKHPDIFRGQLEMGDVLFRGALPARERELAILRIGWLMRAPYEWSQHVHIAKRAGITADEIERVIEGPAAQGWNAADGAILRAVDEMVSAQFISDETWAALAKMWNEQQLIEFPMMVGQYVATAIVQNTLRIRLADGNRGLSQR